MNNTSSLSNNVSGAESQRQQEQTPELDRDELELSCIDLIRKLENLFASAKEKASDDFIDDSADTGRKMLRKLAEFNQTYLTGSAAEQANEEVQRAMAYSHAYDEVLKSRPLTKSIVRAFWNVKESDDILASHQKLGEALTRGCAATFYHAVLLAGLDTELGKQIDQSTAVFVNELQQTWS